MAFDNTVVIVGNATRDPELRQTSFGNSMTTMGIAWNNRYRKGEDLVEEPHFFDVVCFGQLADNVSESITRGMRVVIYGRLNFRKWETEAGEQRQKVEIVADDVCPSLRWASARVEKNPYTGGQGQGGGGGGGGDFRGGGQQGGGQTRNTRDDWNNPDQRQGASQTSGGFTSSSDSSMEEPF